MWSPHSTEAAQGSARRSTSCSARRGGPATLARAATFAAALGALLLVAACSSGPRRAPAPLPKVQPAGAPRVGAAGSGAPASPAQGAAAQAATAPPPPPPAAALTEFDHAVSLMRAGNASEAERRFEVLAVEYPQFAGADINLGILYRKAGQLEPSEQALREAVERNATSAVAWNELGVTLRLRGKFRDAADAYHQAIAADATFAPAYRNLGVLLDLYLGDAPGALAAFERYKELSGEQKPVSGWIAELRHRVGKSAAPAAGTTPPRAAVQARGPDTQAAPAKQSPAPLEGTAPSAGAGA